VGNSSGTNRHWEEEMLAEYLAAHHRGARVIQRVRLGPLRGVVADPTLSESERRLIGNAFRRWADAVLVTEDALVVVEAAMVPDPGDVSRLQTYLLLVPSTPELQQYQPRPLKGLLVWGVDDPFSRQIAVSSGLAVEIFKPSNWVQFLSVRRLGEARKTRPSQVQLQ
jgi:hypothetical protein